MKKEEKNILEKAINSNQGLISPADMINVFANQNRGKVEKLVAKGYLEMVTEVIRTGSPINFYRVTERGLILFEPLYSRIWFWFKGDIRTIIVSAITSLITAIIALLLSIR